MLVSVEMVLEHAPAGQHGSHAKHGAVHEVLARGESKGETARLPEEFDVGCRLLTSPVSSRYLKVGRSHQITHSYQRPLMTSLAAVDNFIHYMWCKTA